MSVCSQYSYVAILFATNLNKCTMQCVAIYILIGCMRRSTYVATTRYNYICMHAYTAIIMQISYVAIRILDCCCSSYYAFEISYWAARTVKRILFIFL